VIIYLIKLREKKATLYGGREGESKRFKLLRNIKKLVTRGDGSHEEMASGDNGPDKKPVCLSSAPI
jgi:hypothetical protein